MQGVRLQDTAKRSVAVACVRKRRTSNPLNDAGVWGIASPARPRSTAPTCEWSGALEGGAGGMHPRKTQPRARSGPVGASDGLGATKTFSEAPAP